MHLNNPFADYGGIITGERFIGRNLQIQQIRRRLLGQNFGNMGIMGLPRVGKSSLAWNAIYTSKEALLKDKIIVLWIPFGELTSINDLFTSIFLESLEIFGEIDESMFKYFNQMRSNYSGSRSAIEKNRYIKKFLRKIRVEGYRLILIFDEFDNAKNILKLKDFQFLRELSYNLETKIGLLTVSRNTIQEIEPEEGALSNFYQIFTDLNLSLYSSDDLKNYWDRIQKLGISVTSEYMNQVYTIVGHHPFLLDAVNYEIFNSIEQYNLNIEETLDNVLDQLKLKIYNEFDAFLSLMNKEKIDSKLVQLIIGPVYDISEKDAEKLIKYGIVSVQNNRFTSFSNYFSEYLALKNNSIAVWPLWSETEQDIRSLIKFRLQETYGLEWEEKFIKANIRKKKTIDKLRKIRNKNLNTFHERASTHLVDYTYPSDMIDCFFHSDWQWYAKIFKKQFSDWKLVFDHLSKIRNPLAHNNPEFLTDADRNITNGYCQNILKLINAWREIS